MYSLPQLIKSSVKSKFSLLSNFHYRVFEQGTNAPDKVNFKRRNEMMAFVDASFNAGVFKSPWGLQENID